MKQNRIFIENLPETATESEIKSQFSKFGDVTSIEIKERKVVTVKHSSCFFAYVNLRADDSGLQKCFQTFNETPWRGEYVKLQIAKESFLERLKRERETNSQANGLINITSEPSANDNTKSINANSHVSLINSVKNENAAEGTSFKISGESKTQIRVKRKKRISTSSSETSEEEENNLKKSNTINSPNDEDSKEIQIKKPKGGAKFVNGLLKIEDFGKGPIFDNRAIKNEKTLDKRQAEAEARRKNALKEKIKAYRQQKSAFTEFRKKPKIIKFNDEESDVEQNGKVGDYQKKSSNKISLFENSDSDADDFNIQKNIESRIKSDERFALDERFAEDENDELNDGDDIDLMEEKRKETEILREVLGQKGLKSRKGQTREKGPRYIRYDPSNPDHLKYELKEEQEMQKNTKKMKQRINEKKAEEKEAPEVSEERLHSVKVDLKSAFGQSSGFSLSDIIGGSKEKENDPEDEEPTSIPLPAFSLTDKNPYKYDSSDNEDEPEPLEEREKPPPTQKPKKVWTEPFFFQKNDFRFQEGLDFVKRIATQERGEGEFEDSRRQFKQIVRNKIRNAKKKNKPFQNKLGGSKKKKMKRMNKALKR